MAPELEASESLLIELSVWLSRKEKSGINVREVCINKGIFRAAAIIEVDGEPICLYRKGFSGKTKIVFGEKVSDMLRNDGYILEKDEPNEQVKNTSTEIAQT